MESIRQLSTQAEAKVLYALRNPYLMTGIKVFLVLYATHFAPRMPESVTKVLQNTYVKILALFLMLYLADLDFQLALLVAIVFVLGVNVLSGRDVLESYADFSKEYKSDSNFQLIEPKAYIYPGCQNLTMADLEKVFQGDFAKMQETVHYTYQELLKNLKGTDKEILKKISYATGLPYNVDWSKGDEVAPYIGTLLMYHGFNISDSCTAPK